MRLKYLEIDKLKLFNKSEIYFFEDFKENDYIKGLYGNMDFSVLAGENGVGKTTIMNFLICIFHHLERFQERIPSNFKLLYDIYVKQSNSYEEVCLEKTSEGIYITVNNIIERCLILENDTKSIDYIYKMSKNGIENVIYYRKIKNYLPNTVTINYEYYNEYQQNFIENYDMFELNKRCNYDKHLSRGILKFIIMSKKNTKEISHFFRMFNFEFVWKIDVNFHIFEYNFSFWRKLLKKLGRDRFESLLMKLECNSYLEFRRLIISSLEYNQFINGQKFKKLLESIIYDISNLEVINVNDEVIEHFIHMAVNYDLVYIKDLYFNKNNSEITLEDMSLGERTFWARIFLILSSIRDNSLVVIEEPELHLNPSWVKQIITVFNLLFNEYRTHFVIATNSYSFINCLFPRNVLLIEGETIKHPQFKTFLANETEITAKLFKSSNVFSYPEKVIIEKIDSATEEKEIDEILKYLGESYIRFYGYKKLLELRDDKDVENN